MDSRLQQQICIVSLMCIVTSSAVRWLAISNLASASSGSFHDMCAQMPGLERRQQKVCQRHAEIMPSVMKGANMSIRECQHQFKDRRWNCSTIDQEKIFGNLLDRGTREAAFVHAIAAAGVSYAVTKSCSSQELSRCGCDKSFKGQTMMGFEWSGCSDNIAFGAAFSKQFTDARERIKKSNAQSLVNLHNNEAGRKMVEKYMQTECKCHGVSGSCELKTCWRALPTFRAVGNQLRESFHGATEVKGEKAGSDRLTLKPTNSKFKPFTDVDLVYLHSSPDFCEANITIGVFGTRGRSCNKLSKALDGCELMCCGRGYHTVVRKFTERCDCKFQWCCFVSCKECPKVIEENICL